MSYDVWFEGPKCDKCGREAGESESHNYTSNMSGCWSDLGAPLHLMEGWPGGAVATVVENAISRASSMDPVKLAEKYDAANGWGHVSTMLDFLRRIVRDGRAHSSWLFKVSR